MKQKRYWFKTKRYGWGWYPATWEGWAVLIIYMLYVLYLAFEIAPILEINPSVYTIFGLLVGIIPPTIILLIICYLKGEKPRWRWGDK